MNVLIIAIEDMRWGPARLPKFLRAAGFRTAALCPPENPLAHTKYLERRFKLPQSKSAYRLAPAIRSALETWQPELVIPADEQVVALLQALLRDIGRENGPGWSPATIAILERSLGLPSRREAMLFKNQTQELAQHVGVRAPRGCEVGSLREASDAADRLGYPVIVKASFSSSGAGVRSCETSEQLNDAYARMEPRRAGALKSLVRGAIGCDWYPTPRRLWVQERIAGSPAMYSFVAVEGRMLAGFAGVPRSTSTATGPSTVVEFGPHAEMAEASARMAAALGATGFLSFDFMIEDGTGKAYLLECNPRPNQVSHLGGRLGVDLCAALLAGLRSGSAVTAAGARGVGGAASREGMRGMTRKQDAALEPVRSETVALFPQEWLRAADSPAIVSCYHDVPWDDESLFKRFVSAAHSTPARLPERVGASNFFKLAKPSF